MFKYFLENSKLLQTHSFSTEKALLFVNKVRAKATALQLCQHVAHAVLLTPTVMNTRLLTDLK